MSSGDWIKMRVNLADDPAVIAMATVLRISPDTVVGKLQRLWSWTDQHATPTGEFPNVNARFVDHHVGKVGFAKAMQQAGWLEINGTGIAFPHFDRHNGRPAKVRAEDAKRKKNGRNSSGECPENTGQNDGHIPDEIGTRERSRSRKRKEEGQKQEQRGADAPLPANKPRPSQLPDGWSLPDPWQAWALDERPDWDVKTVLRVSLEFRDHWLGKGEARSDWSATWRNWVRRERTFNPKGKASASGLSPAGQQTAEAGRRWIEQEEAKDAAGRA